MALRLSLIINLTALLLVFIVSFVVFTPLASHNANFEGHCLLYSTGTWANRSVPGKNVLVWTDIHWGAVSNCNFIVFVGVISMIVSLFYIITECYMMYISGDPPFLPLLVATGFNGLFTLFTFIAACIVSVGFQVVCDGLTLTPGHLYPECSTYGLKGPYTFIEGFPHQNTFYSDLKTAEVGAWFLLVFWIVVTGCFVFRLRMLSAEEDFLTTLNREKDRLMAGRRGTDHGGPDYDQI